MRIAITITEATPLEASNIAQFLAGIGNTGGASAIAMHTQVGGTLASDGEKLLQMAQQDDDNGAPNANPPAVDSAGLPWDARIHSDNKALKKDGTWRYRRNVTDDLVKHVEGELRSRGAQQAGMYMQQQQPSPQVQQMPMTTPVTTAVQMPHEQQQFQPQTPQTMAMPQGGQPVFQQQQPMAQQMPQVQQQQPVAMDFNGFMSHLMQQMNKKMQDGVTPMMDANYLASVAARMGQMPQANGRQFGAVTDVQGAPDMIPVAVWIMTQDGRWLA